VHIKIVLHRSSKLNKKTGKQLKQEHYSTIYAAPDWLLY
jgi:hypothetical protein